ncbi:hypothetical protein SAMN04489712_13310 [Thermomonospora echinospora]|uniref:Uncharacterized protein n=2 Tax=Thermomonospora echinospora TaxID=1992 RepID=A0A1H6E3U1_9ACTN|nr:hypothetical protein SAMN04489712_13310 [Thermomonospora echinospora]
MVQLARGRVALGVTAFLAPGAVARALGAGAGADPGRDLMTRIFAGREIALGAGYLLSKGQGRATWARLGLAVDVLDAVAAMKSRKPRGGAKGVPLWAAGAFSAVAAGAAGLGAAKVARDLTG